ncbi:hypothetical protein Ae201684P_007341 [Aphanomyces euteiches]|uniref:F-box domain-containing protein n=1 Tax=Aphanomyces euteiches TaxID=100861 RepID=A0A6G0WVB9_9STRA|nr:hypothetical protein Ae201684_011314 [Aphanomyces euteiches]KAH9101156.1 hypothetical protein Ae201684P_007341 [Aphanomyces euteiches]KAH9148263.1 hypothetical protein AeRB84_008324 [Aphanomyces euteiches]
MKKAKTSKATSLPTEIVVKVAFFINEWSTVVTFLDALRPAKVLGPLEHLWQLHLMSWKERALWPSLDLADSDQASKVHLEGIAKFYSKVFVDTTTDRAWFRQILDPAASGHWACRDLPSKASRCVDLDTLNQWKPIRIVSIDKNAIKTNLVIETLSCLPYLSEITWQICEHEIAATLFQYAASSSSLRKLDLKDFGTTCIDMSTCMANNLMKWVASQPVQFISIKGFKWKNIDQRHQFMTLALEKPTFDCFGWKVLNGSERRTRGWFNRRKKLALFTFRGPSHSGHDGLDVDNLRGFITGFRPIFHDGVQTLLIFGIDHIGHCNIWPILTSILRQSKVETLILRYDKMEMTEADLFAEFLRHLPALQELEFRTKVSFDLLVVFINAVLPTVKRITTACPSPDLLNVLSEREALDALALERSIEFVRK